MSNRNLYSEDNDELRKQRDAYEDAVMRMLANEHLSRLGLPTSAENQPLSIEDAASWQEKLDLITSKIRKRQKRLRRRRIMKRFRAGIGAAFILLANILAAIYVQISFCDRG